jgi:heme-degrading monooxygenase HmoA
VSEFRSIVWFKVRPGAETAFESAFDDAGMLSRPTHIDGFGGAELLRSTTSPDEYYVVGTWSSPAAYAAWHAISNDGAPPEAMARLIDAIAEHRPGQLFSAVNATGPLSQDVTRP